jgi:beta-lactam-binding protein with PASTA domain
VPDVVGLDLQTAQDTLQEAGYRHLDSIDDTGRGRSQVVDSNWVVVSQSPSAGDQASKAYKVTLFVVKDDEV